jgi:hypothetical protein
MTFASAVLFAETDWGQVFVWGLIGGGIVLAIAGIVNIIRAMNMSYQERDTVESNQGVLIGYIVLGIVLIGGGIILKDKVGNAAEPTPLANFIEYHSKDGRFRASFPRQPKEQSRGFGMFKFRMYSVEEKDGIYGVSYFDLPLNFKPSPEMTKRMLDGGRDGMLNMMDAKLKSEAKISLDGRYPGREIRAEVPVKNAEMYCSIYIVDKRAYQVMILGKRDWLKSDKARKFLNSFELR